MELRIRPKQRTSLFIFLCIFFSGALTIANVLLSPMPVLLAQDNGLAQTESGPQAAQQVVPHSVTNQVANPLANDSALNQAESIEFPTNYQLYPRNRSNNLATIPVSGVAESSTTQVTLRVYRDDVLWETLNQSVAATSAYAFSVQIPAELANYDFRLNATDGNGSQSTIATAADVVAGDLFVINGQSNAASDTYSSSDVTDANNFVRTFGWWSYETWQSDENWYIARRDCIHATACTGQWGLRFGSNIVTTEQIPVAIINGARGGHAISYFQRNDANPTDLTSNYGRLLTRVTAGGIKDKIRGLIWYQGESDGDDYLSHINGFRALYDDWAETYPTIEQYYLFQIRSGCGGAQLSETSNAQREFAIQRQNVTAISTTGLDGHDGCHFAYVDGYQQIGDNVSRIVRGSLYNRPLQNADAADIVTAQLVNSTTVELTFTANNQLVADNGFEALFELRNGNNNQRYTISGGVVISNSTVRLTTAQPIPSETNLTVSYISLPGNQNWLTNQAGIGIQSFLRFPVQADPITPPASCGPLAQEAEEGTLSGIFEVGNATGASGGKYVHVPEDSAYAWSGPDGVNKVSYCATVAEEGLYRIKTWSAAAGSLADSFYVQINGAPTTGYLWDTPTNTAFTQGYVGDRGGMNPVEVTLQPGDHEIAFFLRESGSQLDKFALELVQTVEPPADSCAGLTREAEDGILSGDFAIVSDPNASGGQFVQIPEGNGTEWVGPNNTRKIDYCFTIDTAATYTIEGQVAGADDLSDSFYVRVNNAPSTAYLWDTATTNSFITDPVSDRNGPSPVTLTLSEGIHYVTIYAREDGAKLDKLTLVPEGGTPPPVAQDCTGLRREAEDGLLSGGFIIGNDAAASGGQYIHVPDGAGTEWNGPNEQRKANFCFTVAESGTYLLKAGVYGGDDLSDSYYVKVDNAPAAGYLWDTLKNSSYTVDMMSDRNVADPVLLTLSPGEHTVSVYLREDGTRLDTIQLESIDVGAATIANVGGTSDMVEKAMGLRGIVRLQSTTLGTEINVDAVDFTTFSVTLVDSTTNGAAYRKTLNLTADSGYHFDNLPVGEYLLTLQVPAGYSSTMPEQMPVILAADMVTIVSPDVLVLETRSFNYLPFLSIE